MYSPILALPLVASVLLVSGYPTKADLNCRSGPSTSYTVVRSYPLGTDISITCQTTGPSINGNNIWDKTGDDCYVADYYVKTGIDGYVTDKCDSSGGGTGTGGNLPHLGATQSAHATAIMEEAESEGLGRQGCLAAITTALVESNIYIYANKAVPSSLNYPYDYVGSDADSVGIFQQRAMYYPNIAASMDPAKSAAQFFTQMKKISGWKTMAVGTLCQKVQVSAYPDRYAARVGDAEDICDAGGF